MGFLTALLLEEIGFNNGRPVFRCTEPLVYVTKSGNRIEVPRGFQHDCCSVPRHPWFLYGWLGNRLLSQGTLHDFAYCTDTGFTFDQANDLFLEASALENRNFDPKTHEPEISDVGVRLMYWAVCLFGKACYHKRSVYHKFLEE